MKTKIIKVEDRKLNPETGKYFWVEREETKYVLEEQDRTQFVFEILRGESTPESIKEKYQISSIQSIYSWIGRYVSQNEVVTLQPQTDDDMANKSKDDQIRELKAALKQAQKKAEIEELRAHAYDKMIDLAEGQSFYSHTNDNDFAENALEPLIVEKATEYRNDNPGLGCAKLYIIIKRMFEETGCMPGRDAFIELLRRNKLMVQIKRRRKYKTTDSAHHYHKYGNLIQEIVPMRPNEIWVSDITYVETREGVCFLSLITDAYSRKIVGWSKKRGISIKMTNETLVYQK